LYAPAFRLRAFETISDARKFGVMRFLLEALTMANVAYLLEAKARGVEVPLLYESGVRYLAEPEGRDEWQDIPDTLERSTGDCEDLACWRVAELRVRFGQRKARRGITVSHYRDPKTGSDVTMYHILVLHEDGTVEDPSRLLGMGREHLEPPAIERGETRTGRQFWTGRW
jgi:hypothetical protein